MGLLEEARLYIASVSPLLERWASAESLSTKDHATLRSTSMTLGEWHEKVNDAIRRGGLSKAEEKEYIKLRTSFSNLSRYAAQILDDIKRGKKAVKG